MFRDYTRKVYHGHSLRHIVYSPTPANSNLFLHPTYVYSLYLAYRSKSSYPVGWRFDFKTLLADPILPCFNLHMLLSALHYFHSSAV